MLFAPMDQCTRSHSSISSFPFWSIPPHSYHFSCHLFFILFYLFVCRCLLSISVAFTYNCFVVFSALFAFPGRNRECTVTQHRLFHSSNAQCDNESHVLISRSFVTWTC